MARSSTKSPAPGSGPLPDEIVLSRWKLTLLHAAIIVAAALWIYSPAFHGDWLWDDSMYLSQNSLLRDPGHLWKIWFQPGRFIEYYPIEQTVQWLQWQLWGNDTFGYHLTNVGLHLLSALLVWRLLNKFGLNLAWLGGLIFAIHPIMVESVAWIAELKNTLSLPPLLLAACFWIDYEKHGRRKDYLRSLGFFIISMLCKIGAATFPLVLLLYAWWKRDRIDWRDIGKSAPFFLVSLVLAAATLWCGVVYLQNQFKSPAVIEIGGIDSRIALAGQTLAFYFAKCFWPVGLLPIYPQWSIDAASPFSYLPWIVLIAVAVWLWQRRQGWGRHVLLGLGFFVLMLAPFLGLIPASYMSFSWVMDHFLYVPIIGLIGITVAAFEEIDNALASWIHPISSGVLTVILGLLAFESHWYASAFTNEETLWTYTLDRNPGAWMAYDNLGKTMLQAGEPAQARADFLAVIALKPELAEPYLNLASALVTLGQTDAAMEALNQALQRDPYFPEAHNNLGALLAQQGRTDEALVHFSLALHHHPTYADAYTNMGNTYLQAGKIPEAIKQYELAITYRPDFVATRCNLGIALLKAGRSADAAAQFEAALRLDPGNPVAEKFLQQLIK